jgi:predicted lysophospholipase L1 biosynthesis ABC-type transport system permease subunit
MQLPTRYRVPFGQSRVSMTFLLRTHQAESVVAAQVRGAVKEIAPDLPVHSVQPVTAYLGDQMEAPRYYMLTLSALGAITLVLAITGIYGVVAYAIARRRREIAIRAALGAPRGRIISTLVADAAIFSAVGIVVGLGGALLLSRLLQGVLWSVATTDAWTFATVTVLFCLTITAASLAPMRRALRLDARSVLGGD